MDQRRENSNTSSDEIGSPERAKDDTVRPYYECTFCKRGFTTAQALGGHMNIHRRDRVKKAQRPVTSAYRPNTDELQNYGSYGSYRAPAYNTPVISEAFQQWKFPQSPPPSTRETWAPYCDQESGPSWKPREVNLDLTLNSGYTSTEDEEEKTQDDEDSDLDLELRL